MNDSTKTLGETLLECMRANDHMTNPTSGQKVRISGLFDLEAVAAAFLKAVNGSNPQSKAAGRG